MIYHLALASGAALLATPPLAQQHRVPLGQETTIPYASPGGIRNIQPGSPDSSIVFLQDRRLLWYRVTLSGPCFPDRSLNQLGFRTNTDGQLDRLSTIYSLRPPARSCGVRSITASGPPPGQPGAPGAP